MTTHFLPMQSLAPTENGFTASRLSLAYRGSRIHLSGRKEKGSVKKAERWKVAHCHTPSSVYVDRVSLPRMDYPGWKY